MTPAATTAKTISSGARRERTTLPSLPSTHPSLSPWACEGGGSSGMRTDLFVGFLRSSFQEPPQWAPGRLRARRSTWCRPSATTRYFLPARYRNVRATRQACSQGLLSNPSHTRVQPSTSRMQPQGAACAAAAILTACADDSALYVRTYSQTLNKIYYGHSLMIGTGAGK